MSTARSTCDSPASHFIHEVRSRKSPDQRVAHHVTLKWSGSALWGPCPNHDSGQASTSFSVRHGRYRCFACGAYGDSTSFAMWADRHRLVHDAGLAVPGYISSTPPDAAAEAHRRGEVEKRRAHHEANQAAERFWFVMDRIKTEKRLRREALSLRSDDAAEEEDCRFVERLKRLGVDASQLDLYPDYAP
jgi:hypothetical protein